MSVMPSGLRRVLDHPEVCLGLTALSALLVCGLPAFNLDTGFDCLFQPAGCFVDPVVGGALFFCLMAALLWGGSLARQGFGRPQRPLSRRRRRGFLAAVIGLAAVARLWKLGDLPLFLDYDTAQNGWIALTLWEQLPERGIQWVLIEWATGNETAYLYLVGLSLKLFGVVPAALRLPSALVGTARWR